MSEPVPLSREEEAAFDNAIRALEREAKNDVGPENPCPICDPDGNQVVCCGDSASILRGIKRVLPFIYGAARGAADAA